MVRAMDFGVGYFPTHDGIGPAPLARLLEQRGQRALYLTDHTHIPAPPGSIERRGAPLPRKYWHTYDVFMALTAAATVTTGLRIGTGVLLVIERDPIITARQVATLDHLSGGRFVFGVGAGWMEQEMRHHGTDPRRRMAVLRERIEAMKVIWAQDDASYQGEHVAFTGVWQYPKPVQRPHPPIFIGGDGPKVLDRVLAYGDGWFPLHAAGPAFLQRIDELFARAQRPVEVHVFGVPADPAVLEQLAARGVHGANAMLPSGPSGVVERALEGWESAIADFTGG